MLEVCSSVIKTCLVIKAHLIGPCLMFVFIFYFPTPIYSRLSGTWFFKVDFEEIDNFEILVQTLVNGSKYLDIF